jgi:hypothetical protein
MSAKLRPSTPEGQEPEETFLGDLDSIEECAAQVGISEITAG